jgi:hypothetical protein
VKKTIYYIFFFIIIIQQQYSLHSRSPHRPSQRWIPRLEVDWSGEYTKKNILEAAHLEPEQILKKYDSAFLTSRLLPRDQIAQRIDPEKKTSGQELNELINKLINEIEAKKKEYKDFKVLKDKDFNRAARCGLMVLRFNDHPFVVKLFMERPESFVKPCTKGMQPYFFYYMGGGINRHLMGFTRIKNLETIRELLAKDPYWSNIIDTPRKWFWLPDNSRFMTIRAYNFNGIDEQKIEIPATYAIITDLIIPQRELTLRSKSSRQLGIKLSRIVGNRIDPHMGNFMIEAKNREEEPVQKNKTKSPSSIILEQGISLDPKRERIVLIDTEHFPSLVGLKKPLEFSNYLSWYLQLMSKFATERFFTSKQYRKQFQLNPPDPYLAL